jgi:hypothetical protein
MEKIKHEQMKNQEKQEDFYVKINITRHANRLSTGELREDGIKAAQEKGTFFVDAGVVKGYAPGEKDDKTLRAFKTVDIISESSGVKSEQINKQYETRKRPGLTYSIAGPLMPQIKEYTKAINEAVKKDYPEFDPEFKDPKWGKIREKYQYLGLQNLLVKDEKLVHIFAMGVAHQFYDLAKLGKRYSEKRENLAQKDKTKPVEGDVVLNEGTHGGFIESLLKKSLIRIQEDGQEKKSFDIWVDEEGLGQLEDKMGGIINPTESISTRYKASEEIPEKLPISFEGEHFKGEECFLDMNKIKELHDEFEIYLDLFKKWSDDKKPENEKKLLEIVDELIKKFNQQK